MNEQAIKDSYELFKTGGYSKSYEEFVELINSNPQALEDSYTIFKTGGYSKSMEEYEELMGVKKKDGTSESIVVEEGMESVSPPQPESGSSDVSAPQEAESDLEAYQNTPVTAPQEGVAVADPNLVALQEGESVYDANERVSVALAAEDDAKDQRSAFDRSLDIIDNRQHEQENTFGLNFRDRDYVGGGNIADLEEEEVVGEMDYHFKDYGFKFEETGALGDFMKVTAPNGVDTIEISLDNWTNAKDASESKKLKKFMQQNKPIEKTGLDRIESEALGNEKKILGKRDYEERMTSMQTATIDLKDRVKDFTQRKIDSDRLGKEFSRMGQAELLRNQVAYDAWLVESANIKAEGGEIEGEIEGMKSRGKKLDRLVGSYVEMRSKEGSFGGGFVNSVWEGYGTLFSGVYGTGVDLITASLTQAVGAEEADKWSKHAKGLDRGGGEVNEFSQAASGFMSQERKGIQRLIRERGTAVGQSYGTGTSKEYTDSAGFVESALYGVASSLPAMASGIFGLIAQGIDMVSAETENNPLFEDVSELEKLAIAAPIGIVAGILEKVGLTKAIAGTSAISSVTHNLLKKFGVSATTRTFSEFVENEVERGGSRFLLKMASSGLSEAETGGLQEINDILMKKIYNEVKGQDLFQTPETFGDAVLQVIEASAAEAIGGFAMGTPGAVVSGALGGNLNSVSDETFAVFEAVMNDGPMKEAYIESIKQKIVTGEMTKAEGQKAIQEAEDVAGVASQIPSDYTGDQKKKALGLLLRRAKLQTQVDKGDKQLVTKQQAEIDSINESLKQISEETTTPTITEATTEEAIEALEADDVIREKMTGKPSGTLRTRAVIEKKRQELNKQRQDAIQESSTTEVDVQEQATDGEAMGSGDPDGGTAEDGAQETTDVTGEDTSESEEVAILESLFGSETGKTKEEGETQGTETKGEEAIEIGEKTKIETPDGTELEVEKMEANVGIVSDPKVKKKRSILERAVVKIANTSAKALAKILPDTNIVLHSSPESYKKLGGRGKGMYKGNTIHINLSTATLGTISHEIFHAVLSEKLGTDSRIQLATKDMLEAVMNSITDKDILNRLEKFRLLYEAASQQAGERAASLQSEYNQLAEAQDINSTPEGQAKLDSLLEQIEEATNEADGFIEVLNEEQLAEVTAILAEHYSEANSETKSAIVTWLKKISKTLGLSPTVLDRVFSNKGDAASKNQAVIDLLNTIARKTISGEEITDSDIEILEQYAKPVDKKVAPKARAEEAAPKKKVAPKPKETSAKEEFDIQDTTKRQELNEDGTKNQLGGGEVVPGEAVEDAEGPIPTNIPDSDGPSIDLKTKTKFNLDRGGIDMGSIKRGSVNELSGTEAFVFAADQATYGTTKSPSGLEFKFDGGFLYPYGAQSQGSNAAWVFSTEGAANKIINKANNSDGVGLVMSQASDGITGNLQFYDYINAEVAYAIENGASPKEMINYINSKLKLTTVAKGLKKKGLPSQISSIEELQTLLSPLNFEQRGSFAKTFLSQESYKKFNISPFAPLKSVPTNISEVVNDPSLVGVGYGDVVSAIEFEKGAKPFKLKEGDPGYHPAYPWAIPGKPLMVFDKAVDVRKVYPNAKPASLESNQTPLGERTKPLAARSAMGGQYVAKVPKDIQAKGAKVKFQLDDQGNDLSKLEEDTKYKKGDILPDAYISNNNITDPLNPAKLPKKEFTVTWEEESTWGDRVTRERKFNNGQHFVNFWRKATNDGEWDYLSNFTIHTEGETITRKTQRQDDSWKKIDEIRSTTQPIDIEKLKGWNFKSKVSNPQRLKKSRSHSAYGGAYKTPRVGPSGRAKYQLAWKETPEMNMKESKIAQRTTKVEEAVNRLLRGEITNADYRKIVAKNSPIGPIEEYFAPVSRDRMESALTRNQSEKILAPLVDPDTGKKLKRVGARLDIPAYLRSNAWIVTVHEPSSKGKPISYGPAVRLKNVTFETDARIAANIASGAQGKTTFAKMFGEPVAIEGNTVEEIGTNAQSLIEDVANNSDWVQVGMNPFRHSSFWDRNTGQPLGSAQEIIQIGGLVYAKNPEYLSMDDSSFTVKGKVVTDKKGKAKVVAADRSTGETFTDPVLDKEGSPVKFQLDVDGADASIQEIITEGRGAGLKDSAIGSYLNRIKNVPKNVVKKLLEFDVDLFYKLPKSFAEVEGGLLEGMRLFKNIQDFIAKETKANAKRTKESAAQLKTKVREKRKELTKAKVKTSEEMREIKRKIREGVEKTNKMRVKPRPKKEVDARVKELYEIKRLENIAAKVAVDKAMGAFETKLEKSNAKKRAKLSDQEIMDLAIERLMEHPAYKKLADTRRVKGKDVAMKDAATLQAEMVNALQKTLGIRPTKNMRQALTKLRQMVRFRNQGARQLQEAKRELLRFMRQTLPKTAYSKQEALSLARRIAQATSKEMNGLMHEVIRLSTKKNVGILSRAISKILKPYESKQSGRLKGTSIDNTTRRVVKNLMSNIKFPKTVLAKEIDDRNVLLLKEFNELANKMETTPEERQQMEGLIAAINLNNAMLMEDNDPNKAIALDRAYAAIKGLIDGGRSNLKETLAREKAEFDKSYKEIHKDITGEDIPLYEEDVLDDDGKVIHEKGDINFDAIDLKVLAKKNRARAKETQNRLVKALRSFTDMVKNYFLKQNDLGGMINKISKLPGEIFGGITDQQVVDRIDEGTRVEKANNLMMKRSVENKMKELWGKMWKFKVGALASVNKTGIYIDQTVVDKAQKAYDDNPTAENKANLREAKRDQEISMSQGEAYYLYNQFKDPSNHPSFESRFGKDYERIMGELTSTLDAETKAFADWQVDEFFPMVYPIFNEAYLKVYKTDMPWNEFYAGPLMHDGQAIQDLDLLANKGSNTVVTAGSSKYRVQTKDPIKEGVDGTANLMFYIEEMNHLAGMAEPINYINKLLLNPKMASTIKAIYGSDVLQGIRLSIERVANKGRINKGARFVNFMNSAFITSRLGINPVVMVKQLTSFFTYASDIGYANWVRYAAVNTVQMRKIFKEIKANSVYMDDRNYQSIMKAIETYAPERVQKFMPQPIQNALINIAMWTTKFGDKAAIYIGGMPNYSYHKAQFKKNNPGATEQQAIDYAIRRFEKDTKNTQQSSDIQNKDLYQTGDGYMRVLNMFMTTPKQYNRKVIRSLRNLSRIIKSGGTEGKGTLISNARTILTYHFVMPMFFQWVSLGFPLGSDWDEEDTDDMMRAAIIGNFNSLFIAGDVIGMIADWAQGKPYAFNMPAIPALDMPKNVALYMDKAAKAKTPETKEKWTRKAINEGLAMFGIPASNIQKIFNNFTKLTTEGMEPKEALLRVLQYSDYVIDGPEEKKKKKKKLTDKEMKEYFPEQYKREQELEETIKEMTYNPEVEALEAEIKAMEDEVRREMLEAMRE